MFTQPNYLWSLWAQTCCTLLRDHQGRCTYVYTAPFNQYSQQGCYIINIDACHGIASTCSHMWGILDWVLIILIGLQSIACHFDRSANPGSTRHYQAVQPCLSLWCASIYCQNKRRPTVQVKSSAHSSSAAARSGIRCSPIRSARVGDDCTEWRVPKSIYFHWARITARNRGHGCAGFARIHEEVQICPLGLDQES